MAPHSGNTSSGTLPGRVIHMQTERTAVTLALDRGSGASGRATDGLFHQVGSVFRTDPVGEQDRMCERPRTWSDPVGA